MKTSVFILFAFIAIGTTQLGAQTFERKVIATTGSYTKNSTYRLSATIGETAVSFFKVGNTRLSQGFQQSSIQIATGIHSEELLRMNVQLFPNPTADYLTLRIAENNQPLSLSISDILGNTILQRENISSNERFDVSAYPSGSYLITLRNAQGAVIGTYTAVKVR